MSMQLLFVDDEPLQRESFTDSIDEWNEANPHRTFIGLVCSNSIEALAKFETHRVDCALLDLRLREGGGNIAHGNDLAIKAVDGIGIPVGVISGWPGDLNEGLAERHLLRTFDKNIGGYARALEWFGGLWEMMEVLKAARGKLESAGAEIFASHVWPHWTDYAAWPGLDQASLRTVIARQFAGHIAERLGADQGTPGWHPFECYLKPPLKARGVQTGDMFRMADGLWVVLSPQCDLATKGVDNVLLARCEENQPGDWAEKVAALLEAQQAGDVPQKKSRFFTDLVNQNMAVSKHFLPPLDGAPIVVDFKRIKTETLDELEAAVSNRAASIASSFLPNLTQRFGAYVSRNGQPNIDINHFAYAPAAAVVAAA